MSVSLYDLLDVEPSATAAEIRTAWKAAIADLDPTDRRFRAYNDAAGVLLDPAKRAAYDAELALEEQDDAQEPGPAEPDGVSSDAPAEVHEDGHEAVHVDVIPEDRADRHAEVATGEPEGSSADEPRTGAVPAAAPAAADGGPPTWALAAAGVAAALSVALAVVVLLTWPGSVGGASPAEREDRAVEAEDAANDAEAAAEEAIPEVLSYDYRTLDEDFAEAEDYLTDDFAGKRTALFDQTAESGLTLREQVVSEKVVVTARVAATGVTRVAEDGDRATIVVYVDQDSQKGDGEPRLLQMWATLNMVNEDDEWLLDDICTETDCG